MKFKDRGIDKKNEDTPLHCTSSDLVCLENLLRRQ